MSAKAHLTPEEKAEIIRLHAAGMPFREIGQRLNRSYNACFNFYSRYQQSAEKLCPKCGQVLPSQAKFCFACGTRILTQRETVIEQLSNARSSSTLLPERARDAFLAAVNGAIRYLEGLPDV